MSGRGRVRRGGGLLKKKKKKRGHRDKESPSSKLPRVETDTNTRCWAPTSALSHLACCCDLKDRTPTGAVPLTAYQRNHVPCD